MAFSNRFEAGRRLAEQLAFLRWEDIVVLGLARGGVPVAFEVSRALDAPLDVIVVRKLGLTFQPEIAMGAIGEGGVEVVNDALVRSATVNREQFAAVEERERAELEHLVLKLRGDRPHIPLTGRIAVIVDDGMATGATARAACRVATERGATRVVLAVPVATLNAIDEVRSDGVEVMCLETRRHMWAVGEWYRDFPQVSDEEVSSLLDRAARPVHRGVTAADRPGDHSPISVTDVVAPAGGVRLWGRLALPERAAEMVVFAHASGSGRHSPRNRFVAQMLNRAGLGTLLFDLLTSEEELDRAKVFNIELLARRLAEVTAWLRSRQEVGHLPIGYFGASTGAAAALWAAAGPKADIAAVVSRGGRPDLAGARLGQVRAPTLLIVGGFDRAVLGLNQQAQARLTCENHLVVVPGATHLFEEPGTLAAAAELASDWFSKHLFVSERAG